MTRYADPLVCPDCRAPIEYGVPSCPHCALPLHGATAQLLYSTLLRADQLIEQLRATPSAAAPTAQPQPVPRAVEPRRSRLDAASIPMILLGLGATCLLVAALVFLVVAWSSLGMGGRTAVLLTLTALAGWAASWLAGKGLRAGAESFAVVMLGLVALDLSGAENAGWLGEHGPGGFALILGSVTALVAFGVASFGLRSGVGRLVGAEIVTALGIALVGAALLDVLPEAGGALTGTLVAVGAAALVRRVRLHDLATGLMALAALEWLGLVAIGIDHALAAPTAAHLWGDLRVWPLLIAAALAAVPALVPSLGQTLRVISAGAAGLVGTTAALIVVAGNPLDQMAATGGAVLALTAIASWRLPAAWRLAPLATLTPAAVSTMFFAVLQGATATSRLGFDPWSVTAAHRVHATGLPLAGWLLLPLVGSLVAALWIGADLAEEDLPWGRILGILAPLTLAATLASYDVPLWAPFVALLAGTIGLFVLERTVGARAHVATVVVGATTLAAALPSTWLTLVALVVLTGLAVILELADDEMSVAGLVVPMLLGGTLFTLGEVAGWTPDWRAVTVLAAVALLALGRPRPLLEIGAALTGVSVVTWQSPTLTWLAVDLTVAGALVTASSLVHGRRDLGWVGGALLMGATWVRLADLEVTTPEAYTLPLAAVLVVVGLWRMRRTAITSLQALSPGLTLATVPTLLQVLADPVSERAVLLGAGSLLLVLAGVWLHWGGPLVVGAAVGGLEVLREATYASVLPQWVLIAIVGGLLTAIGVTWEQRLRDLRLAAGYVRGLR